MRGRRKPSLFLWVWAKSNAENARVMAVGGGWRCAAITDFRSMMNRTLHKRFSTGIVMGALGCLWLAGCAAGPELQVELAPVQATQVREFRFAPDGDAVLNDRIKTALVNKGGREAAESWTLETALASRTAKMGAFSDNPARDGQWSETPRIAGARRGTTLHVLSVVLSNHDGTDRRVVQVSARSNEAEPSEEIMTLLVDVAALAAFEGQAADLND